MGCAPSSHVQQASAAIGGLVTQGHQSGIGIVPGLVPRIVHQARRLSLRPHSLETRILQVETVDTMHLEPVHSGQPEAPFVDGKLGLRDLTTELHALPPRSLFEDPDFPANDSSLGLPDVPCALMQWFRPMDIGVNPIWTGQCSGSVRVGRAPDDWLVEALSILSLRPDVLHKVLEAADVAIAPGVMRVRLWRFGSWVTVVMDNRLPLAVSATSTHPSEVWPAVVEKAFAKLHGSYVALAGGDVLWALEDLTGGVSQRLPVPAPHDRSEDVLHRQLFRPLRQALLAGAHVTCRPVETVAEERMSDTWSVAAARRSEVGCQLCLQSSNRNVKQWLDLQAFAALYSNLIVTTLGSSSQKIKEIHGSWVVGRSAGGSRNDLEKFATNPQYLLTLSEPDDPHIDEDFGRCSLLLALLQEYRRSDGKFQPPLLPVACFVYKADAPGERLSAEYFLCVSEEAHTGPFVNRREVAQRLELEPGDYVVIPATWNAGQQGSFLLRVWALKPFALTPLPEHSQLCAMLPTWVPAT